MKAIEGGQLTWEFAPLWELTKYWITYWLWTSQDWGFKVYANDKLSWTAKRDDWTEVSLSNFRSAKFDEAWNFVSWDN